MADYDLSWLDSYNRVTSATPSDDEEKAGWLDLPKLAGASLAGAVAEPLGAAQVATASAYPNVSEAFGGLSMMAHGTESGLRGSVSKVTREASEASMLPEEGQPSFWKTPIRSTAAQAMGLVGPGALLAGAAMVAPEGFLAGLVTDAAAGGIMGASQVADKAAQYYNDPELTDKKLADHDPRFKMLIEQGMLDPKEARNMRMQEVVHDAPLFANGLAGALGFGAGGRIVRGAVGGTGGAISRLALGAGENAVGMGAMGAAGTFADQDLEIAQGKRADYDYRKMFITAANSGAMGAAIGGPLGVLHRPDGRRIREDTATRVEHVDASGLDAANTIAVTPSPPPDADAKLSELAAPGSKPLEPSEAKSQGVDADHAVAMGVPEVQAEPATTPVPEVPVVHPGEPEAPVATVAHPEATNVAPVPEPAPAETTPAPEVAPPKPTEKDDILKKVEAQPRIPMPQLIKEGDKQTSPFIHPNGGVYSTGGSHSSVANPSERIKAGLIRMGYGPDNLDGGYNLWINAHEGTKPTDKQINTIKRLANANHGARVAIEISDFTDDNYVREASGNGRDIQRLLNETFGPKEPAGEAPPKKSKLDQRMDAAKEEFKQTPEYKNIEEVAAEGAALHKGEPTPETPAPTAPVVEARVDPVTGRRILEGPRWGEGPEWSKLQGQTEVAPKVAPEERGTTTLTKQETDQAAKNQEIAHRVLHSEPGITADEFKINNKENRDKLRERLQRQVSDALASGMGRHKREKGMPFENKILQRVSDMSGEMMWLAEANRMLKKLHNKTAPSIKDIKEFLTIEQTARSGDKVAIADTRKERHADIREAKQKGAQEAAKPEEASGDAMDNLKGNELTPEEILLQHEEELQKQLEEKYGAAPEKEAAPAVEGETYTAVKPRERPAVVVARGRSRLEGMRPKVAEKVNLAKRLKEKLEKEEKSPPPPELMAHMDSEDIKQEASNFLKWKNKSERERELTRIPGSGDYSPIYAEAPPKPFGDFIREYVAQHGYGRVTSPGLNRVVTSQFQRAIARLAADTPVYLVHKKIMTNQINDRARAFYHSTHKFIAIRSDLFDEHQNPAKTYATVLHEGVHAALDHLAENNIHARDLIKRMADHVWDELDIRRSLTGIGNSSEVAYAFRRYEGNMHEQREFMTQALSSKEFQRELAEIKAPADLVNQLGMDARRPMSMWELFIHAVRKLLRMPKDQYSMLEAVMRATEQLSDLASREHGTSPGDVVMRKEWPYVKEVMAHEDMPNKDGTTPVRQMRELLRAPDRASPESERIITGIVRNFTERGENIAQAVANPIETTTKAITDLAYSGSGMRSALGKALRKVEANDQLRQRVEKYWPGFMDHNVVRRVFDSIQKQGVRAQEIAKVGNKISVRMAEIQKKLPGAFDRFSTLVHEATMFGVDPASDIGKGRNAYLQFNKDVQAKLAKGAKLDDIINNVNHAHIEAVREHPRLRADYEALVKQHPEFGKLMDDTFSFFHDAQQEMTRGHIENLIRAVSRGDAGAEHVVQRKADELLNAQKSDDLKKSLIQEFGETVADKIYEAKALSGREGPYAPLMRHGDWVVRGRYKFNAPTNAIQQTGPNTFEFATKKEAIHFAGSTGLHHEYDTAYYDPTTGEKTTKIGGVSVAGGPEQRWVVKLQDRYVKFHTRKSDALREYDTLKSNPLFESMNQPELRKNISYDPHELSAMGLKSIEDRLDNNDNFTTEQKQAMKKTIRDTTLSMMAGNRVQSRRLPRRRVEGYSDDLVGNFDIYNKSQANFRAKQEWRPQIDQALKDLREQHESAAEYAKDNPINTTRSEYLKEIEDRARAADPADYTGPWASFTRELSTWSYIYRMGRASHLILHQTHLPMITAPIIAGRHGVFKSYASTLQAWKELSGAYKKGGGDVYKSLANSLHEGTDYGAWIRDQTREAADASRLHKLFATLEELGIVHPQYEIELQRHLKSQERGGLLGAPLRMMNHFDTVFRHATNATEMINRYAGAMAAYRLEYAKLTREGKAQSQAHDLAVEYARNTVANTQGLYSSTNAAPLFKNRFLRPFLQFKQFPQMIYNLMATNLIKLLKGATIREKVEGGASFLALISTHTLMTGVLGGIPLESAKIAMTVTKGLGLTDSDWTDVERWQYDRAVDMFGKEGANYFMHGLSRLMGIDAHHRLGLNSFWTFGLPEGSENNATNIWAFLGQQAAGAPGGLFADGLRATHKIMSGDMGDGLAQLAPQQIRDVYKAWRGGSKDYKYSGGEALARVLGFTPSGEAEYYERKHETRSQVQQFEHDRTNLMRRWADASGSDKSDAWSKIQKWNKGKDPDSQITLKQLTDAAKRKKKAEDEGDVVNGVRLNKRTRFIGERANAVY